MDFLGFGPSTNQAAAPPTGQQDPETAFYTQLFTYFDQSKTGFLQGKQVFGFFVTSNVNKQVLAEIWDEATQKQKGGLNFVKFVVAMKLIALAQNNIAPKRINLQSNPNIKFPTMKYPINPPNLQTSNVNPPANEIDPFSSLTTGFGLQTNDNASNQGLKANGPKWDLDTDVKQTDTISNEQNSVKNLSPNIGSNMAQNNLLPNINIGSTTGSAYGGVQPLSTPPPQPQPPNMMAQQAVQGNQYAPPPTLNQPRRQQTVILIDDSNAINPGAMLTRQASKTLYQEERLREQVRVAEQREKMARKQADDGRILNEKLARENEELQKEIKEARQQQSMALKQSTEALGSIQPLRLENTKLKEAITQWKDLITKKEKELDELEKEVEQLRLDNEKIENSARDDKLKLEDVQLSLERTLARLKEEELRNTDLEKQIMELKKEKIILEDTNRNLELDLITKKDEIKKLQRKQTNSKDTIKIQDNLMSGFSSNFLTSNDSTPNDIKQKKVEQAKKPEQDFEHDSDSDDKTQKKDEVFLDNDMLVNLPDSKMLPPKSTGNNNNNNNDKNNDDNDLDFNISPMNDKIDNDDFNFGNDDSNEFAPPQNNNIVKNNNINNDDNISVSSYEEIEIEEEITVNEKETIENEVLFDTKYQNSEWYIKESDRKKYEKFFKQADSNKDGFVDGGEANKFFTKSKMDRKQLAKIWGIVDYNKKGKLDKWMFFAMFHIVFKIVQSKGSLSIPEKIPECLKNEILSKLGTKIIETETVSKPVTKKIKKKKKVKKDKKKNEKKNIVTNPTDDDFGGFDDFGDDKNNNNNSNKNDFDSFDTGFDNDDTNKKNDKKDNKQTPGGDWDDFGDFGTTEKFDDDFDFN